MTPAVTLPLVVAQVLAALLVLSLIALAVVTALLVRRTRELEEMTARLTPVPDRPQTAAQWALRTVVDTASRVKERGLVGGLLRTPIEEFQRWVDEERDAIRRIAGPDGILTVLFSDIENSTALNEKLGDAAWVKLLREHDDVVRDAVRRGRGYVVKSQGDGFMVVFGDPAAAVRTAQRVHLKVASSRRRLRRTPLKVRIGVHCGSVVARDGDFYGRNVALAARVAASAAGGETRITDDVRAALEAAEFSLHLEPAGEVELKGLSGSHVLWRLP